MGALFHHLPRLHHINAVGLANGGKAMGDRDLRPILSALG